MVLQEPSRAIDAVPVLHPIERMEERRNRLQFTFPVVWSLRYQVSLNARTVSLFSNPPGKNVGAEARAFGS